MLSFDKGSSRQSYPTSLAGSIALLRQFYLDADWYEKGGNAVEKKSKFGKHLINIKITNHHRNY